MDGGPAYFHPARVIDLTYSGSFRRTHFTLARVRGPACLMLKVLPMPNGGPVSLEELMDRWIEAGEQMRADDLSIFKLMLAAVEAAARFVSKPEQIDEAYH